MQGKQQRRATPMMLAKITQNMAKKTSNTRKTTVNLRRESSGNQVSEKLIDLGMFFFKQKCGVF